MAEKVSEKVERLIKPIVDNLGYELVEVKYGKEVEGMCLTVTIDKPSGVTLDDCEKVHNAIDMPLDELDPTAGKPYNLSVSSLGLDRPIKTDRDFERSKGKVVDVKCFAPVDGSKIHSGVLDGHDADNVFIIKNGKIFEIEKRKIANIMLHLDF